MRGSGAGWRKRPGQLLLTVFSVALVTLTYAKVLPFGMVEVFGFISGAVTVWLCVKQSVWNWPTGIVNNIFFIALFWQVKLYADMGLQVVYIFIALYGTYLWLYGGADRRGVPVQRVPVMEIVGLVAIGALATYFLTGYLRSIGDSAPFLDALTTVMSLGAQYMLARKYIENWLVWIAVDIIYIPLYWSKGLPLTGILYVVFLLMCVRGLYDWCRAYRARHAEDAAVVLPQFVVDNSGSCRLTA